MSGINQSTVKVTLRNPLDHRDQLEYYIIPNSTKLGSDWLAALTEVLESNLLLEKNFCFLGWPDNQRTVEYLCNELNSAIKTINLFNKTKIWKNQGLSAYFIEEWFHPNTVRFSADYGIPDFVLRNENDLGLKPKHSILNKLHNHFELLQGTVGHMSLYYKLADYETKYAIRQLNTICHELENLLLSQRQVAVAAEWIRPSQITTFPLVKRYTLTDEHRQGFLTNGYDREFGSVYMHWSQIGKTLFEVWRDEHAPKLDKTICDAITQLQYYSGEFDVEWGRDVVYGADVPWHNIEQDAFKNWLVENNLDPTDTKLSLGYLPIGTVDLESSFGTTDYTKIWGMLSNYLDIYSIEVNGIIGVFDYCWSDPDYKQQQINMMRPGYDFSSRG
jgi:hypothetical protein